MFYAAINYRVRRISWFKTKPDDSKKRAETEKDQSFQNPVYDVAEAVIEEPAYSHDNPVFKMTDDPDKQI